MKEKTISLFLKGIIIGIANMIAGISGGTLAYITGVYENMISALANLTRKGKFWTSFLYLLKIMIGVAVGILLMGKLLDWALGVFAFGLISFFAGVLIGSIFADRKDYKLEKNEKKGKYIIPFIISFILVIGLSFINFFVIDPKTAVVGNTLNDFEVAPEWPTYIDMLILFIAIIFGAIAMIFPGISGSMIFMIFGLYEPVLEVIASLTKISSYQDPAFIIKLIKVIVPLLLGAILSLVFISKPIDYLFKKYSKICMFIILGFVSASIFSMYIINFNSFVEQHEPWKIFVGLLVMLPSGIFVSMLLHRIKQVTTKIKSLLPHKQKEEQ